MPLPTGKIEVPKKSGPPPMCICGSCPVCRNRQRQTRWREKQKLREQLGFEPEMDEGEDEGTDE